MQQLNITHFFSSDPPKNGTHTYTLLHYEEYSFLPGIFYYKGFPTFPTKQNNDIRKTEMLIQFKTMCVSAIDINSQCAVLYFLVSSLLPFLEKLTFVFKKSSFEFEIHGTTIWCALFQPSISRHSHIFFLYTR